ncbi:MAG TPA: iron ABC transporter permease [Capillimicrobium sp.]|nr:iron ABC transporter permease [Capillimicrobium sp.]
MSRRPPVALVVAAVAVVALVCLPLVYLVVRVAEGGADAFDVLGRPRTVELVARTCGLVAATTGAAVAIGVPAAWLVTRTDLPGRRLWTVLLALPLVIPSYVLALALIAASGRGGLLGLPEISGFAGALAALTLATYPYVFLLTAAGLRRLDPSLEEAARSLGQTRARVLWRVTLPAVRPSIGAGALLVALYALSDFGVVSLMRFDALTRVIFLQYRSLFDRTPAAVLGLVLVALTVMVLMLEARASGRLGQARVSPGAARRAARVTLGAWTAPALAFCAAVVAVALVLPIVVVVWWTLRAPSFDAALDTLWEPALRTLLAAGLAAAAVTVAALPVALLAVRHPRRWTRLLERGSFVSNALPGVVVGLSLVFFAARYTPALYGGLAVLIAAYVVRFLPQGLSAIRAALERVDPRLEEAARGLGHGPASVLARVTVPLVAPGLLAGAALAFLSTMKELPATLLLRPIGFDTLATEVWTATGVSAYSRAAVPALALIVLAAPVMWLLVGRGGHGFDEIER